MERRAVMPSPRMGARPRDGTSSITSFSGWRPPSPPTKSMGVLGTDGLGEREGDVTWALVVPRPQDWVNDADS